MERSPCDDELVLTPLEVARLLRVSDVTVRRMVARGVLPRIAGVRVVLIPRSAVDELLEGEYDGPSDGPREGQRDDRPDEDAGGSRPLANRRDDGRWPARVANGANPARGGAHPPAAPRRRFHDLRGTSATLMRAAGVAEDDRMARLGHSTTTMARHYAAASEAQDRAAARRLGRALSR